MLNGKVEEEKEKAEEEKEKRKKEERYNAFKIVKVYKKTYPKGGEFGVDGYFDADITDGVETIRFVSRNVFDFGCFCYPKRLEGTEKALYKKHFTEQELKINSWLEEFSPIKTGIRM